MLSRTALRMHGFACWILIVLGAAHAIGTLVDVFAPTFFAPSDPQLVAEMRATPVNLGVWAGSKSLTMWTIHLGVNFSTGFGLTFIGAVQLLLRRSNPRLLAATPIVPLATALSLAWSVVAAACWFWVPFVGIALATLGFAATWYGLRGVNRPDRLPTGDARLLGLGTLAMGIAGTLHAVCTFPDIFFEGLFSPATPNLRLALDQSDVMLPALFGVTRSTWVAYLGFNVSMGLSVAGFALTAWLLARDVPGLVTHDRALQGLFAAFSALWFTVAVVFWFYAPITVTAIATTCHVAFLWRRPREQRAWN